MRQLIFLIVSLFLIGCTDKEKMGQLESETQELRSKITELQQSNEEKEKFIGEFTSTMNVIYDNLERIRQKESLIGEITKDMEMNSNVSMKKKIMDNISTIENYLQTSKRKLKELREENYRSLMNKSNLEETIDNLSKLLEEKEVQVAELRMQVEELNVRVASYKDTLLEKETIIDAQNEELNSAYFIIGSKDELKDKGIIEEKGGILGIRKAKRLSSEFDRDYFIHTDISETGQITIGDELKNIQIVSPHNPRSYSLSSPVEGETVLEILNPEEFWKIQYLVILTNG